MLRASCNFSPAAPVAARPFFCRTAFVFVQRLEEAQLQFLFIGWVLMPEHFHLLIRPEPAESTPQVMKE